MSYLTIRKTAQELRLPEYTVRNMVKRGEAPGFKSGNRFYINCDLFRDQLENASKASMTRPEVKA